MKFSGCFEHSHFLMIEASVLDRNSRVDLIPLIWHRQPRSLHTSFVLCENYKPDQGVTTLEITRLNNRLNGLLEAITGFQADFCSSSLIERRLLVRLNMSTFIVIVRQ